MEDSEALSEKKLQEIAKAEEAKRRKEHFDSHYERFRHHGKDDSVEPEAKKIPKRPGEKEKEKKKEEREGVREGGREVQAGHQSN